MSIKVLADPNGDFKLDIDTDGVPEGEFLIIAGLFTVAYLVLRLRRK